MNDYSKACLCREHKRNGVCKHRPKPEQPVADWEVEFDEHVSRSAISKAEAPFFKDFIRQQIEKSHLQFVADQEAGKIPYYNMKLKEAREEGYNDKLWKNDEAYKMGQLQALTRIEEEVEGKRKPICRCMCEKNQLANAHNAALTDIKALITKIKSEV